MLPTPLIHIRDPDFIILFRYRTESSSDISEEEDIDSLKNAKNIEADMYRRANSRPEYYHLVVEKIFEIRRKLSWPTN